MTMTVQRLLWNLALTCCVLSSCIKEKNTAVTLEVGDKLPDFSVTTTTGQVVTDDSLLGAISCIVFFHTVCPDCQKTLPEVQKIYNQYLPEGVKFILISREQGQDEIEPYWKERGYTMPYSPQETREVYEKFAQTRIPRVYISNEKGIIKSIFTDSPNPTFSDIQMAIEALR